MATKPRTYHGEQADVTYDLKRCIHAEECIRRLSAVFNRDQLPWAQPDHASPDELLETVLHCPSGALHVERKDDRDGEPTPAQNTIQLIEDGPLYVRGNVTIVQSDGNLVLHDTRVALCRCGASRNKPFCDNSHRAINFQAPGARDTIEPVTFNPNGGELTILPGKNDCLAVTGNFTIICGDSNPVYNGNEQWLCRCGGSSDKPFCDKTHQRNGFQAD